MSRGVNKVILIGNLGRDPELSYSPSGMAIARFSLATAEGRKRDDGTWEDVTEWHRVVVFGKSAEMVGQYVTKGKQVYIEGRIHYDQYEKDGVKRYTTDIIAREVKLLGPRDDSSRGGGQSDGGYSNEPRPPANNPMESEVEDDLPF